MSAEYVERIGLKGAWIGFWGSILGAIIGAIIMGIISNYKSIIPRDNQIVNLKALLNEKEQNLKTMKMELATAMADIDDLKEENEALMELTQINKEVRAEEIERMKMRRKASSLEVQTLLKPFTTKSLKKWVRRWYTRDGTSEEPVSLSFLRTSYALSDSDDEGKGYGIHALVSIATSRHDDRPRWGMPTTEKEWNEVRKAKEYLIELGPTLVELGYLAE